MEPQSSPSPQNPDNTNSGNTNIFIPGVAGPTTSPQTSQLGVQPNIVAPAQPVVGSQLDIQTKKSKKWTVIVGLLVLVCLVVGALIYSKIKSPNKSSQASQSNTVSTDLSSKTLQNQGITYTFKFFNDAQLAQTSTPTLVSPSRNVIISANPDSKSQDCSKGGAKIAFTVTVEATGKTASVCEGTPLNDVVSAYVMAAQDGSGQWQGISVIDTTQSGVTGDITKYNTDLKQVFASFQAN